MLMLCCGSPETACAAGGGTPGRKVTAFNASLDRISTVSVNAPTSSVSES